MRTVARRSRTASDMAWMGVALIGGLIVLDGVGSVLIKGDQYHGFWFDLEREVRALGGCALVFLAAWEMAGRGRDRL
jgi:hypothetical protein